MKSRQSDDRRRELARQVRRMSVDEFHDRLARAGIERAFAVFENGELTLSHPRVLEPLRAFLELSQDFASHEGLFFGRESGLETVFVASVHDTRRGLAQGGVRFKPYDSLADLVSDSLRLAHGMTRKNALAGLWWGGGKGVVPLTRALDGPEVRREGDPRRLELFGAYGRFVASLGGVYYTAEDVGTKTSDMNAILGRNRFTTCVAPELGGSGNPSPHTARGVYMAMRAAWRFLTGTDELRGVRVAVQGIGNVGGPLVEMLDDAGARLWVTDVDRRALEELGRRRPRLERVEPEEIFDLDVDVFCPCAIGAQVNVRTIPRLRARLVCGAANNVLGEDQDAERLRQRGIVYVPDYLSNRLGIVNCADEWQGYLAADVELAAERVYPDTLRVLEHARRLDVTPAVAADQLADAAAAELHPMIGHRGRRIVDRLLADGWHRPVSRRRRDVPVEKAFEPGVDEPALRARWEREGRFRGRGPAIAAAPIAAAGRPELGAFFSAVLADVAARARELSGGEGPRRIFGSDPGGLSLERAAESALPVERQELGRSRLRELSSDLYRRNDAALRDQLRRLGVGFDPGAWIDTFDESGLETSRRLYAALEEAGLLRWRSRTGVEPEGAADLFVELEQPAAELVRAIAADEVSISHPRWRRRALALLEAPEPWCVTRQSEWGHPLPPAAGGSGDVLSVWWALAVWSLQAVRWPGAFEPVDEVWVDGELLARWWVPSQLVALAVAGRPAFRRAEVHEPLHAAERALVERPGASPRDPDEERFVMRTVRRPLRHAGAAVEPAALVRRFGADALRLGYLLSLSAGGDRRATLAESHLRRARRTVGRLSSKVTGLHHLSRGVEPSASGLRPADRELLERAREAAEAAREAYAGRHLGRVARLLCAAVDDFAGYARSAVARRRDDPEGLSTLRATVAAALAVWHPAFSPVCPHLFGKLRAWTAARAPEATADVAVAAADDG